jgi:hypothetical protein
VVKASVASDTTSNVREDLTAGCDFATGPAREARASLVLLDLETSGD